jgi:hypothetical protein
MFIYIKFIFKRYFTRINISKVIVIYIVGFIFRYLIKIYLGINVSTEYLSIVSIIFYLGFAVFIVFINEFFSFFKISIIPNFR